MNKCMVTINPTSGKEKASEYEKKIIAQNQPTSGENLHFASSYRIFL